MVNSFLHAHKRYFLNTGTFVKRLLCKIGESLYLYM